VFTPILQLSAEKWVKLYPTLIGALGEAVVAVVIATEQFTPVATISEWH
jgi:hypothetical protein